MRVAIFTQAARAELLDSQDWYEAEAAGTFPYGLYFTTTNDAVIVVACFHASRDPKQWQERM